MVEYDLGKPSGHRVVKLEAKNDKKYEFVQPDKIYNISVSDFLSGGGKIILTLGGIQVLNNYTPLHAFFLHHRPQNSKKGRNPKKGRNAKKKQNMHVRFQNSCKKRQKCKKKANKNFEIRKIYIQGGPKSTTFF